jgi:membrane-bound metal-dependent hydrolase YbcI (DUF457 family)
MFIGHYSASLVAKRLAPEVPLALLFVAAQAVDIGWAVLIAAGIEQVRIVPGFTAASPLDLHYMPFTHSLPAALAWAVAVAAVAAAALPRLRNRRAMLAIAAVVFSHWLLDWVVHVPDLPLWGNSHKVGLGLWNHFVVATVLECALFVGAAWWLDGAAKAGRVALRRNGYWIVVLTMTMRFVASLFGPPPPSTTALWVSALLMYAVLAAAAWWMERRSGSQAAP